MLLVKLRLRRRRKRNERHLPISMWEEEFVWPEDLQQEASPPHMRGPGIQADNLRPCLSWQCIQPAADSGNSWSPEDTFLVLEKKKGGRWQKGLLCHTCGFEYDTDIFKALNTKECLCYVGAECMGVHVFSLLHADSRMMQFKTAPNR